VFAGVIDEIGTVRHVATIPSGRRIEVAAARAMEGLEVDHRISVSGVALTVVERDDRSFAADVPPDLLQRTTLGGLARGSRVNLERAATPHTALGGQFVQGHVDATTKLVAREDQSGATLRFALPQALARFIVTNGAIALDGVSLAVTRLGKTFFEVSLVPHIAERTTLGALRPGEAVNVEVDVIAKYVERIGRRG